MSLRLSSVKRLHASTSSCRSRSSNAERCPHHGVHLPCFACSKCSKSLPRHSLHRSWLQGQILSLDEFRDPKRRAVAVSQAATPAVKSSIGVLSPPLRPFATYHREWLFSLEFPTVSSFAVFRRLAEGSLARFSLDLDCLAPVLLHNVRTL
jgi:hypothetical protein